MISELIAHFLYWKITQELEYLGYLIILSPEEVKIPLSLLMTLH